jgi:hypothetical protein
MNANSFTVFTEPVALLQRSPGRFLPNEGVFSRLFPELPPHEPGGKDASATLRKLAATLYDDGTETVLPNLRLPAAYTFFAQFVAHDMSFDPSRFGQRTVDGVQHANLRTPRLDLDHVYGGDPDLNANLYETDAEGNTYRFLIDRRTERFGNTTCLVEDLPRFGGRAVIPDQRDDQHVIVSQLHLAVLKLHNLMMDQLAKGHLTRRGRFFEAQRLVRWHYQHAIVEDFLPRLLGESGLATFAAYRERWMGWQREMVEPPVTASVPVEFSVGVYRVGHSSLRSAYQINDRVKPLPLFVRQDAAGPVNGARRGAPISLAGSRPRHASLAVSWDRLLEVSGSPTKPQYARLFSDTLSRTLRRVPGTARLDGGPASSDGQVVADGLAELDLERGLRLGLPSGQAIARRLGIDELDIPTGNDPLWYYAMKEVRDAGRAVGPVAAAIISKVFLDLLHLDPGSYLFQRPNWTPQNTPGRDMGLSNLLHMAGMPFSDAEAFPEAH